MFEIGVERVNYWTFTCSIKLYKNKGAKVFPITKEEFESFELWKFNNSKVDNIIKRKQLNVDRNHVPSYTYDLIKCECGYSWIMKVNHIPKNREYLATCPKCSSIIKNFKN